MTEEQFSELLTYIFAALVGVIGGLVIFCLLLLLIGGIVNLVFYLRRNK